jgi:hypothetical protein
MSWFRKISSKHKIGDEVGYFDHYKDALYSGTITGYDDDYNEWVVDTADGEDGFLDRDLIPIDEYNEIVKYNGDLNLTSPETFYYGRRSFDVRKAKRYIAMNSVEVSQFNVEDARSNVENDLIATDLNRKGLEVDLSVPIIVASIENWDKSVGRLPIDGWHRIAYALKEGIAALPMYLLSVEETKQITS